MPSKQNSYFILFLIFICILGGNSCNKESMYIPQTGTIVDGEGNEYKTVKIGNQWWMAENLRVTKYRNGQYIRNLSATTDWEQLLPNYISNNNNFLYNFYAVIDTNNIAPVGWHIPTDEEWKKLELSIGMFITEVDKVNFRGITEGDELKSKTWNTNGILSTDYYGFNAKSVNCRLFNGQTGEDGTAIWWSSTENKNNGWIRYLDTKKASIFRYDVHKNYGFSIRCVKD